MKTAIVTVLAVAINLGMFVLMDGMISQERVRIVDLMDAEQIEFIRSPIEEETRTRDRRSAPPPKPQEIERPRAQVSNIAQRASALPSQVSNLSITSLLADGGAGVAIGQTLIGGGGGSDLSLMMADDLIPLSMLPPQYPPGARQQRIEGWVDVVFTVDPRGLVSDAEVVESSPPEVFNQAALNAALRWRFRPVEVDGEAITVLRLIRINFSLEQSRQ